MGTFTGRTFDIAIDKKTNIIYDKDLLDVQIKFNDLETKKDFLQEHLDKK
jgi:hypothetical protein